MHELDSQRRRAEQIERLQTTRWEVLILGGGILGAGVARDAALRGFRVALIEQHDLASGTSSRTSRLLHGGIRYLAQGRLGLVYEANREKRVLHRIAPHLAEPLALVFPTYRGTPWPLWKLRLGVRLYDKLCGKGNLGPSCRMRPDEVVRHLPSPRTDGLTGAVRYYDGLTQDARLVLDTLRSAAAAGAVILNYVRAAEVERTGGLWRCHAVDQLRDHSLRIAAESVVHATGPWAEVLPASHIRLHLTKGVHLVIPRHRLPVPDAVVMTEGKRVLFAIPWGERVILGTTDTEYSGRPEDVRPEPADVDYLLDVVNGAFPAAGIDRRDVVSAWAGVRPLIARPGETPSELSRAHQILQPHPGWIDVAGGKLTTYRRIAQQVVDRLCRYLGRRPAPCRTADLPLLEAEQAAAGASGVLPPEVREERVAHYCTCEWAVHLDDVMTRRTSWRYYHRDDDQIARQVARWMGRIQGWDPSREEAELARYRQLAG